MRLRSLGLCVGLFVTSVLLRSHSAAAAWPPAPDADLKNPENWPNDPGYRSMWQYFSYLPDQKPDSPAYLDADRKLGASGMSIDRAWTLTTGRPDVVIAVLDSGIQWDAPDLVNKANLNRGELSAHKPQQRDSSPCGGAGPLAGFDCNGDGVFSVADYRDDPRVFPPVPGEKCFTSGDPDKPGADRIKGDANRNCVLDAGDLIELFTDGIDDDANGYADDIAGWDFYKNDNNPYDDTRYGHGTGEAKDATQEGNNGIEGIGVCPACRFVPLRVGDSFIADSNDFAKAAIYAADNGASVVQEALGTIDMTSFARAAIDYAYSKRVIVVASMADENSRHHNFPASYLHNLPVHAVRYAGDDFQSTSTFLAFNNCTNYGGQLALSVSGTSCSSEATGRAAGIAGLIHSYARAQPSPVTLTAEEIIQLFKMTADDIEVPESRRAEFKEIYYPSKPGFDQRFGYGRANAYRALTAIRQGLIPPEVDIVSPGWFDILHSDRAPGSVPVLGRVAASRAQSYDVVVEYAPGVEPDDNQFLPLAAELRNVPANTVMGGADSPLATFDPREVDTNHVADSDSLRGENDRTLTLRVRAVAHYAGGDVRGEARRTIAVVNSKNGSDPDLLPGFPIKVGPSLEGSAKLVDLDGDRMREIIVPTSDGQLQVLTMKSGTPVALPGFPYRASLLDGFDPLPASSSLPSYRNAPAYARGKNGGVDPDVREAFVSSPAVGDLDNDGVLEIVASTWGGTIHVVDATGQARAGFPQRLPLIPSCPLDASKPRPSACMDVKNAVSRGTFAAPVLVDLDADGKLDIVQAAFDGKVYALRSDGLPLAGFPVEVHSPTALRRDRIMSTPAVADLNGDGVPDLVLGSNEESSEGVGLVFAVDGRGTKAPEGPYLRNWPLMVPSVNVLPVVAEGIAASPVVTDLDRDGQPDVLLQGNGSTPLVVRQDPGPQTPREAPPRRLPVVRDDAGVESLGFRSGAAFGPLTGATAPDSMFPVLSTPAVGDLDLDGVPDVVMTGAGLSLALNLANGSSAKPFQHLLGMWNGATGAMMPASPVVLEDYTFFVNSAVADLSGDGYPEVIAGTAGYFVHAVDACGREAPGFPKFTNGWHTGTAAVGDLDGDRGLEVVAGTREGYLFAWHTRGKDDGVIQWDSFHHDARNSGDARKPLDQGRYTVEAPALACTRPPEPPVDRFDAGGGCACTVVMPSSSPKSLLASGVLALVLLGARRRRRPRSR
jgi:MYXO-CTERM domain-containing protein